MRFFSSCTRPPVRGSGTIARSGRRQPRRYAIAAILLGVETEYAVIGMSSRGEHIDPNTLTERLIARVRDLTVHHARPPVAAT
jgi:hypothetical protein